MVDRAPYPDLPAFLGGRWCLDFVNTVDPREPAGHDFLPDYTHLLRWAAAAGVVDHQRVRRARATQQSRPDQAIRAHAEAINLREALYQVLRAAVERRDPPQRDSKVVIAGAVQLQARRRLQVSGGCWRWEWADDDPLKLPGAILLADALDLLTDDGFDRLGICAGEACGWLFTDATKNHTRRWCSMAGCGNRAKTLRHSQRQRRASTAA